MRVETVIARGSRHCALETVIARGDCHCEVRSAEAIPCLTSRGTLVRQEIASALRA
jgi:hypothetical protein